MKHFELRDRDYDIDVIVEIEGDSVVISIPSQKTHTVVITKKELEKKQLIIKERN